MHEGLRLVLILLFAAAAVTGAAMLAGWWLAEPRRLARAFRRGLGGRPDAALVAHGSGRGVALSLAAQRLVTVWDGGGWRMDYGLGELMGAELDLDGEVAGRVMRGEPRRLLDRQSGAERTVRLRLLFDDPHHPDFELVLWPSRARGFAAPREAIAEANRWLARLDAILRRANQAPAVARRAAPVATPRRAAPPDEADLFEPDDAEDEDSFVE
ncbi:MAG TPA: hypothetical protein VGG29_09905 [Caulobacteraceae bacterium]|jgi:hypothetical protein